MPSAFLSRRRIIIAAIILGLTTGAYLFLGWIGHDRLRSRARRRWKDQAIATIEQRLADKQWFATEQSKLAAATEPAQEGGWSTPGLIVLQNGDWMICQNVCSHEHWYMKDLLIGRGSDGKWYYSTFHFCKDLCVLQIEPQPQNLAQFVDAFWLRPFDGRSDECLNLTWTGREKWGSEKLRATTTPATGPVLQGDR